jgi:hypothetical protein
MLESGQYLHDGDLPHAQRILKASLPGPPGPTDSSAFPI